MTDYQRIFVVGTQAGADEVARVRSSLGSDVVVLTAPTGEAKRVVDGLGVEPLPDVLLAPVRFPDVDRGHRLDELVRRHAVQDRFRDVVVVTDPATVTLLLVPRRRHLGEALLIAVAVAVGVSLLSIAGSSRFPGSW